MKSSLSLLLGLVLLLVSLFQADAVTGVIRACAQGPTKLEDVSSLHQFLTKEDHWDRYIGLEVHLLICYGRGTRKRGGDDAYEPILIIYDDAGEEIETVDFHPESLERAISFSASGEQVEPRDTTGVDVFDQLLLRKGFAAKRRTKTRHKTNAKRSTDEFVIDELDELVEHEFAIDEFAMEEVLSISLFPSIAPIASIAPTPSISFPPFLPSLFPFPPFLPLLLFLLFLPFLLFFPFMLLSFIASVPAAS